MKIMFVITRSELGGAQSVVVQLANALCHEHDILIVAGEGDGKMWDIVDRKIRRIDCPHLQKSLSLKSDIQAAIALRRIYRKYRPDVIHLHSSKAGALGRMVLPSKKIVYTVHGFDSIRIAFRKFIHVERLLQRRTKAIVGVSEYDRKNMIKERINKNVSTVYNGLITPNIDNIDDIEIFKRYSKIVLSIARINPQKNPGLFIEVARLLPEYGFIWIGNQKEVTEFGELPPNCHFVGNIVNAGAYCSKCDIFMLASNYEGLPMVIIEAMSLGKPVVASNVGGVSEIVRNDINGYVVENSAELFAKRIKQILDNEELYNSMSEASLDIYNKELTVDRMVDGYLKIYNSIK